MNEELWKLRTRPIPELMQKFGLTYDSVVSRLRRMRVNGGPLKSKTVYDDPADEVLMSSPPFIGELKKKGITTAIIIPDMQIPYHNEKAMHAVEWYMGEHKWDYYINIGDFIDVEGISHFNKDKPRTTWGKELIKEYKIANRVLDTHQSLVRKNNKDAKFHYIFGNHEERVEKWLDEHPQLAGLVEVPIHLKLLERGFTWTRDGHMGEGIKLGKLNYTHGDALSIHHSKTMAETWGGNVVYGHVHTAQRYTRSTRDKGGANIAMALGCLCHYDLPYVKKKPSRWSQGFGVVYYHPDGSFNLYFIDIVNDEFISPDGKHYY